MINRRKSIVDSSSIKKVILISNPGTPWFMVFLKYTRKIRHPYTPRCIVCLLPWFQFDIELDKLMISTPLTVHTLTPFM